MAGKRRLLGVGLMALASIYGLSPLSLVLLSGAVLGVVFVVIPSIFHLSFVVQRHMIFLPWVKWPKLVDFDCPENEGLVATTNFYLRSSDDVDIGVWHILPSKLIPQAQNRELSWYRSMLSSAQGVFVYLHGNTASRARDHRLGLYDVLRKLDFHVVAFDYRGYADSTPVLPTKRGVVDDAKTVYEWVCGQVSSSTPIFVWGHSLGSAVACALVAHLCSEDNGLKRPSGLILESPFNNIRDEIKRHPMTYLWRKMPFFEFIFTGSLDKGDVFFASDQLVQHIDIPLLLMHAKDDLVIPFELGKKLFEVIEATKSKNQSVHFVPFEEDLALGHVNIYTSTEIPHIVKTFTESVTEKDK